MNRRFLFPTVALGLYALAQSFVLAQPQALTVPHLMGQTELKTTPQRIVVLEFAFMDFLAKLGVKPLGAAGDGEKGDQVLPHLQAAYPPGSVTFVGSRAQPSLEKILALKPDLIIADEHLHTQLYPQFQKIAPTLLLRSYRGSYTDQIEQFNLISRVVGHEALGQRLLAQHRQLLKKAQASSKPAAGRVVVGVLTSSGFFVHSDKSYLGSLLEVLGRDNPASVREGQTQYAVSLEGLLTLNPDTLIVLHNPEDEAVYQQFVADPLVQGLNAAKAKRLYTFNRDAWAKGRGIIGLEGILNDVVKSRVLSGQAR